MIEDSNVNKSNTSSDTAIDYSKAKGTHRFIDPDSPLSGLAEEYLYAMLACERKRAYDLVMSAVDKETSIRSIYLDILQPVQYEIGWLWQNGKISVGHEHYCTNSTQLLMSMLYPKLFNGMPGEKRMLSACVEGELHELGLRMLTDFFEMEGWDTDYLGANTPGESIIEVLETRKPDIVAIGVTMHYHLDEAGTLISRIRESPVGGDIPVLVGGYSFRAVEDLWKKIGADGTAGDAKSAISRANELIQNRN